MSDGQIPKVELLRQALLGIQAHAAGMQASAQMALHLLGEIRSAPRPGGPQYGGRPAAHYGDPEPQPDPAEIEQIFQRSGGIAPEPADSGESTNRKE